MSPTQEVDAIARRAQRLEITIGGKSQPIAPDMRMLPAFDMNRLIYLARLGAQSLETKAKAE